MESLRNAVDLARLVHEVREGLIVERHRPRAIAPGRPAARNTCYRRLRIIGFWKVAKIIHFLAAFQVHPWTVLTFHEPVPQMIE